MKNVLPGVVVVIVSVALCCFANAKEDRGLWFSQAVGMSVNPLGIELDSRCGQVVPLITKPGILWENTKLNIGVQNSWTPTDDFFGARVQIEPIAFFDLTARMGIFVIYDQLGKGYYAYTTPDEDYHRTALQYRHATTRNGWQLSLEPTFKLKIQKLILTNTFTVNRILFDAEGYYLEYRTYTIHRTEDTNLENMAYAFWEIRSALLAGLNYRFLHINGTSENSHRISVIAVLLPKVKYLQNLRVILAAGGYIDDPLFKHKPFVGVLGTTDFKIKRKQAQ